MFVIISPIVGLLVKSSQNHGLIQCLRHRRRSRDLHETKRVKNFQMITVGRGVIPSRRLSSCEQNCLGKQKYKHQRPFQSTPSRDSLATKFSKTTIMKAPISKETRKENRKINHSLIEKRRRGKMNECLKWLNQLVPPCSGIENMHKLDVLEATVQYILTLQGKTMEDLEQFDQSITSSSTASTAASPAAFHPLTPPKFRSDYQHLSMSSPNASLAHHQSSHHHVTPYQQQQHLLQSAASLLAVSTSRIPSPIPEPATVPDTYSAAPGASMKKMAIANLLC